MDLIIGMVLILGLLVLRKVLHLPKPVCTLLIVVLTLGVAWVSIFMLLFASFDMDGERMMKPNQKVDNISKGSNTSP
jgi:hypothetical protein